MNHGINQRLNEISALLERRAFPIGTTRSWKKGPHAKTEQGWRKHGQSHMGNVDRPLPDARVSAFMASVPPMESLSSLAAKLREGRKPSVEEDDREFITTNLIAGYEKGGIDGLKLAAYKLEPKIPKKLLASVLKGAVRDEMLDGLELVFKGNDAATLLMYADDLARGR